MPTTAAAASPGGFVAWIEAYGQIIGFFIQILFYIIVSASAAWAATTFAKYVKYMTTDVEDASGSAEKPVDEFVE